jgi:hypothetical protein
MSENIESRIEGLPLYVWVMYNAECYDAIARRDKGKLEGLKKRYSPFGLGSDAMVRDIYRKIDAETERDKTKIPAKRNDDDFTAISFGRDYAALINPEKSDEYCRNLQVYEGKVRFFIGRYHYREDLYTIPKMLELANFAKNVAEKSKGAKK